MPAEVHQTFFDRDDSQFAVVRETLPFTCGTFESHSQDAIARLLSCGVSMDLDEEDAWAVDGARRGVLHFPPLPRHVQRTADGGDDVVETAPSGLRDSVLHDATAVQHATGYQSVPAPPARLAEDGDADDAVESVMIRGSNGIARWITMADESSLDGIAASPEVEDARLSMLTRGRGTASLQPLPAPEAPAAALHAPAARPEPSTATSAQDSGDGGGLWVSRHAPRSFAELLSDEDVNLEVLRWLKPWHSYVLACQKQLRAPGGKETSQAKKTRVRSFRFATRRPAGGAHRADCRSTRCWKDYPRARRSAALRIRTSGDQCVRAAHHERARAHHRRERQ
jgi:hypothetical protein